MNRRIRGSTASMGGTQQFLPLWEAAGDLSEIALWLWQEWGRNHGSSLAETGEWLAGFSEPAGRETGFAAYRGTRPVGVALLRDHDLATFRELTPWLSSLFVLPSFRGTGIGSHLIQRIEHAAIERDACQLYLYTMDQERFYARRGWLPLERFCLNERDFVLMSRRLGAA